MIASLLSPSSSSTNNNPPARISQLLPTVKCSTCHQPVPLAELGEHTCTAPPPVPSLPKPAFTPEAATALLPDRLQGRVANASAPPTGPIPSSGSTSRLRLNVNAKGPPSPTQPPFLPKSSPLSRADSSQSVRNDSRSPQTRQPPYAAPNSASHSYSSSSASAASSPLRTRPPGSAQGPDRMRTPSNAGSISNQSTPSTARPGISFLDPPSSATPVQPGRPIPNSNPNPNPRGPPTIGVPFPTSSPYPNRTGSAPPLNFNPNPNYRPGPQPPGGGPPRPPQPSHSISEPNFNREEFVPPAERGIDTKSGGAAGMAGVGRRGFAAAARAAMFVNSQGPSGPNAMPPGRPMGPQMPRQRLGPESGPGQGYDQYTRRPMPPPNMAPRLLDTDLIPRSTNETPPLSAGSGYSSHSPGPPMSPIAQPGVPFPIASSAIKSAGVINPNTNLPPMAPLPPTPVSSNANANPLTRMATSASASSFAGSSMSRSQSGASSSSLAFARPREKSVERPPVSPIDSESEYGGLAYADSTDDEEHEERKRTMSRSRSRSGSRSGSIARNRLRESSPPPPPLSSATATAPAVLPEMLRKISTTSSTSSSKAGMQFGSVRTRSRSRSRSGSDARAGIRIGASTASVSASSLSGSISRARRNGGGGAHSRDTSVSASSAYSSVDGEGEGLKDRARARTNSSASAAIAQALGLSQTPPAEYARLGGPGVSGASRSRSVKRDGVLGSASGSIRRVKEGDERANREKEENGQEEDEERRGRGATAVTAAAAARVQKNNNNITVDVRSANEGGAKTQRSNTVQGLQSPDAAQKPIKLPTRSLTSPQLDRDKALGGGSAGSAGDGASRAGSDVSGQKKTARRPKTCLRCAKMIENGRWISVDSGGVLCESCWKNMYLPKCRRCNLPIERQAVSSSDGQLKGKYHKECFNCHICHKPFPDQSFYVYDGRPLCAYHYHEANDSLCAAALCGQPIEGPCAVSHSGDRYHPEHMTCEHPGRVPCAVRLEEYWEVDGRMLCERHAAAAGRSESESVSGSGSEGEGRGGRGQGGSGGEKEEWERRRDLRAMKRVTRFIDLAGADGLGPGAGAGAGAGSRDSDSGLR